VFSGLFSEPKGASCANLSREGFVFWSFLCIFDFTKNDFNNLLFGLRILSRFFHLKFRLKRRGNSNRFKACFEVLTCRGVVIHYNPPFMLQNTVKMVSNHS
jgi:hypothetical protein